MWASLATLAIAAYALLWLASLIFFVVSALRSKPITPEEERALMRSLSSPTENGEGFAHPWVREMYARNRQRVNGNVVK